MGAAPKNFDDARQLNPALFLGDPSEMRMCVDLPRLDADATALVRSLSSSLSALPSSTCPLANSRLLVYAGEARRANVDTRFDERKRQFCAGGARMLMARCLWTSALQGQTSKSAETALIATMKALADNYLGITCTNVHDGGGAGGGSGAVYVVVAVVI